MEVHVRVPATTANLGPGFDALGLALDLWNEATFTRRANERVILKISGEGAGRLAGDERNAIAKAALRIFELAGEWHPGLQITCHNRIPLASGLGSSAAAVLTGMLAANALLGAPFGDDDLLKQAIAVEGHPDNAAPAMLGGLVVSAGAGGKIISRKLTPRADRGPIFVTVVLPEFHLPTREARAVLPDPVARDAAVFNISRSVLVVEALLSSDLDLLGVAMADRLHQPYRLPLIPGAQAALAAAKEAGAAAAALSGAGPSLVAFSANKDPAIGEAMHAAFQTAGLRARIFQLQPSEQGAQVS